MTHLKVSSPLQRYYPGLVGGGISAAIAAAMSANKKRKETSKEHAFRVIRNALLAGTVGGVGTQLTAQGLSDTLLGVGLTGSNDFNTDTAKGIASNAANTDGPGFGSSPAARAGYGAAANIGMRAATSKHEAGMLSALMPKGIDNVTIQTTPSGNQMLPMASTNATLNHVVDSWTPTNAAALREKIIAYSKKYGVEEVAKAIAQKQGIPEADLLRVFKSMGAPTGASTGEEVAGIARRIGGKLLNPINPHSPSAIRRFTGGTVGNAATLAAALLIPDLTRGAVDSISDSAAEGLRDYGTSVLPGTEPQPPKGGWTTGISASDILKGIGNLWKKVPTPSPEATTAAASAIH